MEGGLGKLVLRDKDVSLSDVEWPDHVRDVDSLPMTRADKALR